MLGPQLSFFIMGYFPFVTMGPHLVWTLLKVTDDPRPYTETFSLGVTSSRKGDPGITGSEQKPEKDV